MIHGNIEEALDLLCVQVHRQNAVSTGSGQKICHQFGCDRHSGTILSVLTGIAVERDHRSNTGSRRTARRIDHNEQFHQIFIGRTAGGLNDKHVCVSQSILVLHKDFAVGEAFHIDVTKFQPHT